jgi:hypothetical protein
MVYTEKFKVKAVSLLEAYRRYGTIVVDGVKIQNMRELIAFLKVSSKSLYDWEKETEALYLGQTIEGFDSLLEIDYDSDYNGNDHEYPSELFQNKEKQQEVRKSAHREMIQNGSINGIEFMENHSEKRNIGFGVRFWAWFAKSMGISGYSRMNINELKAEVGLKLLKEAGFKFPMKELTDIAGKIADILPNEEVLGK